MPGENSGNRRGAITTHTEPKPQGEKIFLGLVLHNHQPVGNFPWIFASAYEKAYLPMVQALEKHSSIHLSMHYSGPLLDWILANRPEFLGRVAVLAAKGQIEIVGGAYYDPILPSIPDSDRTGQIAMMSSFCSRHFGNIPAGLWLAERVWEPSLPVQLAQAGIEWTVVDDTHFKMVGLTDDNLFGYYITEDQGYPVKVFATSKFLRYSVPFKAVEDVMAYLRAHVSSSGVKIAVMGDDGEKFGVWPQTYEHCWGEDGWIERFFTAIEKNADWLSTITLGAFSRRFPALGRIYLPCASYDEMLEWAMPADRSGEFADLKRQMEAEGRFNVAGFMHGGYWRHFAVKYPEANWMHKRMLRVHRKLDLLLSEKGTRAGQTDLWQAQCNCPYWHGVFGGLYLADIRAATYQHLIEAENKADVELHPEQPWLNWERTDVDADGQEELVIEGSAQNLYVSPAQGGALVEWDLRRPGFNVLSSLARRPEAYHKKLIESATDKTSDGTETIHTGIHIKDPRATRLLAYDRQPRFSLIDRFLGPEVDMLRFVAGDYEERGDFSVLPYESQVLSRDHGISIELSRRAHVFDRGQSFPVTVRKSISLESGRTNLHIEYKLANEGGGSMSGILGVEWNINLLGGGHNDQAYFEVPGFRVEDTHLDSSGELPPLAGLALGNRQLGIRLELSMRPPCAVWRFPVETVSNSEAGIERLYQATCLLLRMPFTLSPGQETGLSIDWRQCDVSYGTG